MSKPPYHREEKKVELDEDKKWNFFEINPPKKYFTTKKDETAEEKESQEGINEPKKYFNQKDENGTTQ